MLVLLVGINDCRWLSRHETIAGMFKFSLAILSQRLIIALHSSTLPCQMLSWVEYYRPRYFLLENVAGIQDHILYFHVEGDDGETNEVKVGQGMVKFIFRALIALGYVFSSRPNDFRISFML